MQIYKGRGGISNWRGANINTNVQIIGKICKWYVWTMKETENKDNSADSIGEVHSGKGISSFPSMPSHSPPPLSCIQPQVQTGPGAKMGLHTLLTLLPICFSDILIWWIMERNFTCLLLQQLSRICPKFLGPFYLPHQLSPSSHHLKKQTNNMKLNAIMKNGSRYGMICLFHVFTVVPFTSRSVHLFPTVQSLTKSRLLYVRNEWVAVRALVPCVGVTDHDVRSCREHDWSLRVQMAPTIEQLQIPVRHLVLHRQELNGSVFELQLG